MKYLFFSLLLFSSAVFAADEKENLANRFAHYAQVKLEDDTENSIDKMVGLKLNEQSEADLELVKNIIRTLVKLDIEDPSRTSVMILSRSYYLNLKLYRAAFASLKTKGNQTQLSEIESVMKNFKFGNG